jgi:hypothetical protein
MHASVCNEMHFLTCYRINPLVLRSDIHHVLDEVRVFASNLADLVYVIERVILYIRLCTAGPLLIAAFVVKHSHIHMQFHSQSLRSVE